MGRWRTSSASVPASTLVATTRSLWGEWLAGQHAAEDRCSTIAAATPRWNRVMAELSITSIGAELLDDPTANPAAVAESLRNIARANRWFGGATAVRYGLRRTLGAVPPGTALTLLDLGTGLGDLPQLAVRWGAARGIRIQPIGVELNRMAGAAFWCGAQLLGFDDVTIADGMTSVRRGFSRRELLDLLSRAGISGRVDRSPGFRLVATWSPAPSLCA